MDRISILGDLCRSGGLTESSLLSNLENRYKDDLTESYIGSVLMRLSHSTMTTSPVVSSQFLPLFCSSIVQSLVVLSQDHSLLVCGRQSPGKGRLVTDTLSDLLLPLDDPDNRAASIVSNMQLLRYLCRTAQDDQVRGMSVTTLLVDPLTSTLKGAHFSLGLLDTTQLSAMQVFSEDSGIGLVVRDLQKIGMSAARAKEVEEVLEGVAALLSGGEVAAILKDLGVHASSADYLISADKLSQLLYAYLVHWLVLWLNSVSGSDDPRAAWISLLCTPGLSGRSQEGKRPGGGRQLASLVLTYADELLHNIYCTRLFVWEQEQYLEEGLNWEMVEVDSNETLINTFQKDHGLLDSLSKFSLHEIKEGVANVCQFNFDSCFMVGGATDTFTMVHLTGESEYTLDEEWLAANEAHVVGNTLQALLQTSSCSLLVQLAKNMSVSPDHVLAAEPVGRSLLTQRARFCMDAISDIMTTSDPHFVISLEPDLESSGGFHADVVQRQLQEFKVLDTALMQSYGYPVRIKHAHFLKIYGALLPSDLTEQLTAKRKCERILQEAVLKDYRVGRTTVMLKPWHPAELDSEVELYHASAKRLQHALRRSLLKKRGYLSSPNISILKQAEHVKEDDCSGPNQENVPPVPPPRPSHTLSERHLKNVPALREENRVTPEPDYHMIDALSTHHPTSGSSPSLHRKNNSWKKKKIPDSKQQQPSSSDLKAQAWFLGPLSREKAEECLKMQPCGTFMIRESQKRLGEYSLSLSHGGIVKHFRVDTKGSFQQRFQLYGAQRSFSTLLALVEYYSQLCISPRGELLTTPYSTVPEAEPKPPKRKLTTIHRPQPGTASGVQEGPAAKLRSKTKSKSCDMSLNVDSLVAVERRLEVEERIVEAARRMAEMPAGARRERQKRKQSLQMAQSKLMSLRQEYHILKQRNLFIEYSMHPVLDEPTILQ